MLVYYKRVLTLFQKWSHLLLFKNLLNLLIYLLIKISRLINLRLFIISIQNYIWMVFNLKRINSLQNYSIWHSFTSWKTTTIILNYPCYQVRSEYFWLRSWSKWNNNFVIQCIEYFIVISFYKFFKPIFEFLFGHFFKYQWGCCKHWYGLLCFLKLLLIIYC